MMMECQNLVAFALNHGKLRITLSFITNFSLTCDGPTESDCLSCDENNYRILNSSNN